MRLEPPTKFDEFVLQLQVLLLQLFVLLVGHQVHVWDVPECHRFRPHHVRPGQARVRLGSRMSTTTSFT
eukprot:1194610-Prorocentrum_minimum.AAC.5